MDLYILTTKAGIRGNAVLQYDYVGDKQSLADDYENRKQNYGGELFITGVYN